MKRKLCLCEGKAEETPFSMTRNCLDENCCWFFFCYAVRLFHSLLVCWANNKVIFLKFPYYVLPGILKIMGKKRNNEYSLKDFFLLKQLCIQLQPFSSFPSSGLKEILQHSVQGFFSFAISCIIHKLKLISVTALSWFSLA